MQMLLEMIVELYITMRVFSCASGWMKNSRNPQNNQCNGQEAYGEIYIITVVLHDLILYEFMLHTYYSLK